MRRTRSPTLILSYSSVHLGGLMCMNPAIIHSPPTKKSSSPSLMPVSLFFVLLLSCRGEVRFPFFLAENFRGVIVKATAYSGGVRCAYRHPIKKELLVVRQRRFPNSYRRRECDHIGLICCDRHEGNALRLSNAVLTPQMPVRLHCECAPIFVSKPARYGRNIHTAFDAARREQMPQIVMGDAICAHLLACPIQRLLAFADAECFCVQRFARTVATHSLK